MAARIAIGRNLGRRPPRKRAGGQTRTGPSRRQSFRAIDVDRRALSRSADGSRCMHPAVDCQSRSAGTTLAASAGFEHRGGGSARGAAGTIETIQAAAPLLPHTADRYRVGSVRAARCARDSARSDAAHDRPSAASSELDSRGPRRTTVLGEFTRWGRQVCGNCLCAALS